MAKDRVTREAFRKAVTSRLPKLYYVQRNGTRVFLCSHKETVLEEKYGGFTFRHIKTARWAESYARKCLTAYRRIKKAANI